MEARVKSLTSVEEKLTRKSSSTKTVADLTDLVGLRLILLFKKDLEKMDEVIRHTFRIVDFENTADRLDETQFGYQSNHYLINLPDAWLKIPSYADLGELTAEVQVRTLAQHIWAATSHKLQYKREESVPPPLRRTIHRVSALLETVDLEFERVLDERATYVETSADTTVSASLNVDLVAKLLGEVWPTKNADETEDYDELLDNLNGLGITTVSDLRDILERQRAATLRHESSRVAECTPDDYDEEDADRYERGVYYTHVGLTRDALTRELGKKRVWGAMGFGELAAGED